MILLNHTSKSSFDFHYIQPHLLSNAHHPQCYGKLFYFHFFFFSCLHFYSRIAMIGCHHNNNYSCHWYVLHVFLLLMNNCILLDYVTTHDHPARANATQGGFYLFYLHSGHLPCHSHQLSDMKGTTATTTTIHTHIHHNISSGTLVDFFHHFFLSLYS